jgi:hypothetical protein
VIDPLSHIGLGREWRVAAQAPLTQLMMLFGHVLVIGAEVKPAPSISTVGLLIAAHECESAINFLMTVRVITFTRHTVTDVPLPFVVVSYAPAHIFWCF